MYGFLAIVLRAEPTETLLREIKGPAMRRELDDLGVDLGADFFERQEAIQVEELAVEYARLFLGPGSHISPHESVHHEVQGGGWGTLWGEETVKAKRFIEAAGLEYDPAFRGIPDHVSVELEFLQKLSAAEASAWEKGESEKARYGMTIEKRFIDEHTSRWIPSFCDKVAQHANATFYREMAALTKSFLEFGQAQLDDYLATSAQPPE